MLASSARGPENASIICGAGEGLSVAPIMFHWDLARSQFKFLDPSFLFFREEASCELESHPAPAHRSWLTNLSLSILLA